MGENHIVHSPLAAAFSHKISVDLMNSKELHATLLQRRMHILIFMLIFSNTENNCFGCYFQGFYILYIFYLLFYIKGTLPLQKKQKKKTKTKEQKQPTTKKPTNK